MSESLKEALSIRDQRMIVAMYQERDPAIVAERFNLSRSAIGKRFEKIHDALGPLFEFGRKRVSVLAHTQSIVEEIEKGLIHLDQAIKLTSGKLSSQKRSCVNLCVVDQLESVLLAGIHKHIKNPDKIQVRSHQTASNQLDDRVQNLFEVSRLLEMGDLDILIYYEFDKAGLKTDTAKMPPFYGLRSRELTKDKIICMVNENAQTSNPMTIQEYQAFKRAAQVPSFVNEKLDIPWVITHLNAAATLISIDPTLICNPPSIAAKYFAENAPIKLVPPPEEEQCLLSIRMIWTQTTEDDEACATVRSAIVKTFTEL